MRHELTFDASGAKGIAAVERTLEGLREIPIDRAVQRAVLATMRELAATGSHGALQTIANLLSGGEFPYHMTP